MKFVRSPRLVAVGATVVALALSVAACSSSKSSGSSPVSTVSSAPPTSVTIGLTSVTGPPTFLPLIADKMGLAAANGLTFKYSVLAPAVAAQTLAQGSVDIMAAGSLETATLAGAPNKIIAGAALSYWHIIASSSITDWSDLKGKKVALPCAANSTCYSYMVGLLEQRGLSATSVTFIAGTAQSAYEAMAAGSVDAVQTTAPYTYALKTAGKTHELDSSGAQPYLSTQYTATSSYVTAHPAVVNQFVKTLMAAEAAITKLPIDPQIIQIIDNYEKANGIDPTTLDQEQFLTEFANDKSWSLVPTKALMQRDLDLIKTIPALATAAGKATFDDLVYMVPALSGRYG